MLIKKLIQFLRALKKNLLEVVVYSQFLSVIYVKDVVHEILGNNPLIHLIPPAAYPEFLWLLNNSSLILTDSGGVQEEAPSLGKPVLLLRDTTERPEAVEAGTVLKVGSDAELIYTNAMNLLTNKEAYDAMAMRSNPYGDGLASQRIVDSMLAM